ncbi:tryptophan halogenase family protein [Sphingomonas morindae]|uniref:Tryptophan 7-halogenase n=1 Tax=Sphingomonas morindae TaxID=1541170 RepID=A0ABY4X8Z4_9SPHN|nr:tryptophan halogenase family protein [Sphingomonas morindae]USI73407.1 tryptophan 7-halogenase [Sphingomonas morindae]
MSDPLRRLVILGGGTAGWLTAAYLARALPAAGGPGWAIALVESADVPTIGVGEGSFPTLRATLATLGRSEAEFLRAADASFKQGVHFVGWAGGPTPGHAQDAYFHPFELPVGGDAPGLLPFWLDSGADEARPAYADAVTGQAQVVRAGRGPKRPGDPDWAGPMNYAYHFDAARLALWLRDIATANGVAVTEATIVGAERGEDGGVAALRTAEGERIEGDIFIDCSGFRALLIGETLGSPFHDVGDVLFNDRAVALQVPSAADAPIAPYTLAVAQPGGWIWDIGLADRRGTGLVYSSRHWSDEAAAAALRAHGGHDAPVRQLRFRTGYRTRPWIANTIAVGLAAGFVEPLESTGIMLVEVAARMLAEMLSGAEDPRALAGAARGFNRQMTARFAAIVEFLKLHYCAGRRRDTGHWRDHADPATWPDGLADKLAQWRRRLPSRFDFTVDYETFLPPSWAYILHGLGFATEAGAGAIARDPAAARNAIATFARIRQAGRQAAAALPDHRALVMHYRRLS